MLAILTKQECHSPAALHFPKNKSDLLPTSSLLERAEQALAINFPAS